LGGGGGKGGGAGFRRSKNSGVAMRQERNRRRGKVTTEVDETFAASRAAKKTQARRAERDLFCCGKRGQVGARHVGREGEEKGIFSERKKKSRGNGKIHSCCREYAGEERKKTTITRKVRVALSEGEEEMAGPCLRNHETTFSAWIREGGGGFFICAAGGKGRGGSRLIFGRKGPIAPNDVYTIRRGTRGKRKITWAKVADTSAVRKQRKPRGKHAFHKAFLPLCRRKRKNAIEIQPSQPRKEKKSVQQGQERKPDFAPTKKERTNIFISQKRRIYKKRKYLYPVFEEVEGRLGFGRRRRKNMAGLSLLRLGFSRLTLGGGIERKTTAKRGKRATCAEGGYLPLRGIYIRCIRRKKKGIEVGRQGRRKSLTSTGTQRTKLAYGKCSRHNTDTAKEKNINTQRKKRDRRMVPQESNSVLALLPALKSETSGRESGL